jgi:ComF family protein
MNLEYIMRLLFPPKCIFCGCILDIDTKIEVCKGCYAKIPFICERLPEDEEEGQSVKWYDDIICACEYKGMIKDTILKLKFNDKPYVFRGLAAILAEAAAKAPGISNFDAVVAVPLHKKRERQRGYNHMGLIAAELGKITGCRNMSKALVKIRHTDSQNGLSRKNRLINLRNAFKVADIEAIKGKKVLLVDDVFTTGSTANECSKALKEAGAIYVTVGVIASGRK